MKVRLLLFYLTACLLFATQAFGQVTVKGQVLSGEDSSPLVGVNIVVKGADQGGTTDIDGYYLIQDVATDAILVVSYVGYRTQEVAVNGQELVNIQLAPEAVSGDEVVVIGYGTAKRKDLTNAVASIDESSFNKGQTTDFQQLLQSRVPGVQISASNGDLGAEPLIRIRGGTSISASNGPMIVIDGVPVGGNSSTPNFDPDDNNTGGEAGEDGPSGGYRENPLASLNPYDIQSIDILKDASAAAIYGARAGNGVILITTKSGQAGGSSLNYDVYTSIGSQSNTYDLLDASEYSAYVNSAAVQDVLNSEGLTLSNVGTADTDWQDAISRNAFSHSHNLSFSSGTDNTSYLISMNYLDEEGIILGSDRQRISGRLNVAHKAMDNKLKLNLRLNPSFIQRNNTPYRQTGGFRGGLFTNVLKYNPTLPVTNADGTFFEYPGSPDIRNPVAMAELIEDESSNMRIFANLSAEYDIIPELSAKVNLGLDRTDGERGIFQPNSLPYAAAFGGRADIRVNDAQNALLETTLNYNKQLQGNNELSVWAGYSFQDFESTFLSAAAEGFVTDRTSFNSLIGGQNALNPRSFAEDNRLISFLGRVIYNMNSKYIINAALRREGSSRFGENNKWGLFPSASIAWRLSEDFFANSGTIDDMKLRVSYGITGNQDIGNYLSQILLEPGANAVIGGQNQVGFAQEQLANPDLKWEETSQINVGLDFGIMENKIAGSIDIYQKNTTDLLLAIPVPQPSPVGTQIQNIGEVENRGIEFNLNTINASSGKFFWRSNFNIASNQNEVTKLRGSDTDFISHGRVSGAGQSGVNAQIITPGQPLGTFFTRKFEGYDADGNEILSSTGGLLGDGRFIVGDAQPDFTYGFSSTMVYGSFDFRFAFQGVQGIDLLNNTALEYQRPSNVFNGLNLLADAVDDVADGLDVQANPELSDRFIEDASYLRLQNVTLGYNFNNSFFRNLRVYLSADNLFLLTGYSGLDPEVNTFAGETGPASLGIDYTNYPRARVFTVGMNIGVK